MPDVNPDAVKLLSDDALREIDELQVARKRLLKQGKEFHLETAVWNIDTLCATVRALRVENKKLKDRLAEQRTQNRHLWEANKEIVSTNTALREQLAHVLICSGSPSDCEACAEAARSVNANR